MTKFFSLLEVLQTLRPLSVKKPFTTDIMIPFLMLIGMLMLGDAVYTIPKAALSNGTNVNIAEWKLHPNGTIHLGEDGVLRSHDDKGTVLNYALLSPDQIKQLVASHHHNHTFWSDHYRGADGRNVTDPNQLTGAYMIPRPTPTSKPITRRAYDPKRLPAPEQPPPKTSHPQDCGKTDCIGNAQCHACICGDCINFAGSYMGLCNDPAPS
ncbi:hypothetical protein MMC12_006841 [Toensbergia leucococca]|nr:hypothetical protein [Toensbergia leucococca]